VLLVGHERLQAEQDLILRAMDPPDNQTVPDVKKSTN
jgi:hypothetical protein